MKKVYGYLKSHIQEEFDWKFHIIWTLLLASGVYYKFSSKIDHTFRYTNWQYITGILLYAIPFLITVLLYAHFKDKKDFLFKKGFWLLAAFIIFVLYANDKLQFYKLFTSDVRFEVRYFLNKCFFNIHSSIFYIFIPFLYWRLYDKKNNIKFYGLERENFDYKPYLYMLLIMIIPLIWASFQNDFLNAYPRYRTIYFEPYAKVSPWITVPIYELTYSIQFVALEIFFRGFIVLALAKYMGKGSVWVMVALYGYMHFGKPMAECISSFFGGYILGVIALYTRNTYGGMLIHIGIALGMELLAFIQIGIR